MVTVKLFGAARINYKDKEVRLNASTVKEVLEQLAEKYDAPLKDFKQFVYFVNDVNIDKLKMYRTPLKEGDVVMVISLGSGG